MMMMIVMMLSKRMYAVNYQTAGRDYEKLQLVLLFTEACLILDADLTFRRGRCFFKNLLK
jgi:hypothetical protein